MSKIYISYNTRDREFVSQVAERLKVHGHALTMDLDSLTPGQDWRGALTEGLRNAEVFIVFISEASLKSQFVLSELGAARAYSSESERMLLIPIIIDNVDIPPVLRDLHAIVDPDRDAEKEADAIERAISAFAGRRAAREERAAAVQANAADYVVVAIKSLIVLERRNRFFGTAWYVVGFAALVGGVLFGAYGVTQLEAAPDRQWIAFAMLTLKAVVLIGLVGACAKYAFTLGRSYIGESLKSADRIHAIEFGRFYLQAFGTKATWPELKEVFQHWNIDRGSTFSTLDTSQFDPKVIESLVELTKLVTQRKGDGK